MVCWRQIALDSLYFRTVVCLKILSCYTSLKTQPIHYILLPLTTFSLFLCPFLFFTSSFLTLSLSLFLSISVCDKQNTSQPAVMLSSLFTQTDSRGWAMFLYRTSLRTVASASSRNWHVRYKHACSFCNACFESFRCCHSLCSIAAQS